MNKYLMLSAAALLASTTGALAKSAHSVVVSIGSYCDGVLITRTGRTGTVYAYTTTYSNCVGQQRDIGMSGGGKNVTVNFPYDSNSGFYTAAQFQLPFKTGNVVNGYYTTNGINVTQYLSTTYKVYKVR